MVQPFATLGGRHSSKNLLQGIGIASVLGLVLFSGLVPSVAPGHPSIRAPLAGNLQTTAASTGKGYPVDPARPAGGEPRQDGVHASAGLYVNLTEQTLSLINNTVLQGNPPTAHADGVTTIEYDPGTHDMIAGGVYSNAFVAINASRNAMVGGFTAGSDPSGLAFEPGSDMVWVANYLSNSVMLVNGTTDAIVGQILVGQGPSAVAYDPGDHRLFVAESGNYTNRGRTVTVIDTITDQVTAILPVGTDPNALLYLPATGQLYVSNYLSSNVTIINGSTLAIRATIPVGSHPLSAFYDYVNKDLYFPTTAGNNVTVLDPYNDTVLTAIAISGGYPGAITLNPSNNHLFILGGTQVSVVDGSNQTVMSKVNVAQIAAYGIVYDPVAGDVYVAGGTDNDVKVLDGSNGSVLATIPSYYTADGVAFDPESRVVYVANQGSNNISVIDPSTRTAIASLDVAPNPFLSTGGPANGTVFVGAACPGGLAELNGTTGQIQMCLSIPGRVAGLTYDGQNGRLYVSDGNSNITVVDTSNGKILDRIYLGDRPYWAGTWVMALDPQNGTLFVPNYDWGNMSVLNLTTDSVVKTIPAGPQPEVAVYDPIDGSIWVSEFNSPGYVDRFNASTYNSLPRLSVPSYPEGMVYDPNSREMYVADSGAAEVSVFSAANGSLIATIPVGTNDYSLGLDPTADIILCANAGSNNVTLIDGTTHSVMGFVPTGLWPRSVAFAAGTGFAILPDQNSGAVTLLRIQSGPVASAFPVTFSEMGLPSGTPWSVSLGGLVRSSSNASITFEEPNGSLPFSVGAVAGLTATPGSGVLVVTGGAVTSTIAFSTATYTVTFVESGLTAGASWSVILGGIELTSTNSSIVAERADGVYTYTIPPVGGRTATPSSESIQVSGLPVTVPVTFGFPTYRVSFVETGLALGTNWSVSVNGHDGYSTGISMVFELLDGPYNFTVATSAPYIFSPKTGSFNVSGAPSTITVTFRASYAVTFHETGLPNGTTWTVTLNGTPVGSSTASVAFFEPDGSYAFRVSVPSGYVANVTSGVEVVNGGPRSVLIGYSVQVGSSGPLLTRAAPWIPYAIVGVVAAVAVAVGILRMVRRRRQVRELQSSGAPPEP